MKSRSYAKADGELLAGGFRAAGSFDAVTAKSVSNRHDKVTQT